LFVSASLRLTRIPLTPNQRFWREAPADLAEGERNMVAETGRPPEYEIFMAIADKVGWDLRGNPVYVRTPEGEEVLRKTTRNVTSRNAKGEVIEITKEVEEPMIDDQLPAVTQLFKNWLAQKSPRWLYV